MSEKKDIREELKDKKLLVDKLPKEEWRTFVWAVAEGESTTEAYLRAYPHVKRETAWTNGCRLLRDARVAAALDEILSELSRTNMKRLKGLQAPKPIPLPLCADFRARCGGRNYIVLSSYWGPSEVTWGRRSGEGRPVSNWDALCVSTRPTIAPDNCPSHKDNFAPNCPSSTTQPAVFALHPTPRSQLGPLRNEKSCKNGGGTTKMRHLNLLAGGKIEGYLSKGPRGTFCRYNRNDI